MIIKHLSDVLAVVGLALIAVGLWFAYAPAAPIAAGVTVLWIARNQHQRERATKD